MSSLSPPERAGSTKPQPKRHDARYHLAEHQPLLADGNPGSDVEAQDDLQSHRVDCSGMLRSGIRKGADRCKQLSESAGEQLQRAQLAAKRNARPIVLALLLSLLAVSASLGLGFFARAHVERSLCTSAACVHAASELLHNLSPDYKTIDPCQHFDVLVCQGFEQRHDLRPDQGDMFRGTLMAEDAEVTLKHILEGDPSGIAPADRDNFLKLQADYMACMNEDKVREVGLKPLLELTEHIKSAYAVAAPSRSLRDSPAVEHPTGPSTLSDNGLADTLLYMNQLGVSALFSMGVGADDKDPEIQAVFLSPPRRLGLPSKEYYQDSKTVASYTSMMGEVLSHFFGAADGSAVRNAPQGLHLFMADLAEGVVELETKLAAATPSEEDLNDITKSYNKISLSTLEEVLPQVSLGQIILGLAPTGYEAKTVIVSSPSYMAELSKTISSTTKEVMQAYLVWKSIQSYASRIESSALQPLTRFNNKLQGKEPDAKPDRWRTCINGADADLGWILSKFFVDQAFSPESKQFGNQIVSDIKGSFVAFLNEATWMTKANRERAITKVHAIDQKIGYPTSNPDILNPDALREFYKGVAIKDDLFFENAVQVAQFEIQQEWSKLGQPTRHDEWGMTVPTVNAYYNPAGNEIVFPAGIMQQPVFYDLSVPQYLSYGAFGAVSGHELSHAFDNTGSQYDETGKFNDWWSNETRQAFEEKTACFVEQYSRYSIEGADGKPLHVNGNLTLGENVADAGGLHAAFKAWKKREAEKPSKLLPGLEYFTKDQLFFVNYANWWCGKSTKETAIRRIYTDPHAPKWTRILGTMANSADFKEAFSCPTKKPTCELW